MGLLEKYGVAIPRGAVARSAKEALAVAESLGTPDLVIKAQVLAGGRGRGHFDSGLKGGVRVCFSPADVADYAHRMLGHRLITKQTGADGRPCSSVYVVERKWIRREVYFAIVLDRESRAPVVIASSQGGMNIEDVAHESPEAIIKVPVDISIGLTMPVALDIAARIGFGPEACLQAADTFRKLYSLFCEKDSTMIEINPMAETSTGEGMCY